MWNIAKAPFNGEFIRWRDIDTKFNQNHTIYNEKAEAPYILDSEHGLYLGFENKRSISAKAFILFATRLFKKFKNTR